jgi:hypothetical protein
VLLGWARRVPSPARCHVRLLLGRANPEGGTDATSRPVVDESDAVLPRWIRLAVGPIAAEPCPYDRTVLVDVAHAVVLEVPVRRSVRIGHALGVGVGRRKAIAGVSETSTCHLRMTLASDLELQLAFRRSGGLLRGLGLLAGLLGVSRGTIVFSTAPANQQAKQKSQQERAFAGVQLGPP